MVRPMRNIANRPKQTPAPRSGLRMIAGLGGLAVCLALASGASGASGGVDFSGRIDRSAGSALSPLSAQMVSFSDKAALRLRSSNTTGGTVRVSLQAFDSASARLDTVVSPGRITLGPGQAAMATVIVPLAMEGKSSIKVCAVHTASSGIVTRSVCGHYIVERRSLAKQ